MVYLDYSATTPANKEVLDTFVKASENYTKEVHITTLCNIYGEV